MTHSSINDGGPVHPTTPEHGFNDGCPGMTLRDHFAGQTISGVVNSTGASAYSLAHGAFAIADAMIEARDGPTASFVEVLEALKGVVAAFQWEEMVDTQPLRAAKDALRKFDRKWFDANCY